MTKPLLTGVLKTWKEDRGFGFISPDNGGRDLFIHISAFGQTSRRPVPGDIVHYQIVRDRNGKYRAINARIEGVNELDESSSNPTTRKSRLRWVVLALTAFLLAGAGAMYLYYQRGGFN
ncbi:MAG: cold shock domain-containing protein [Methyloglobulus sp.]|nr:cold shock domain-containing protein [Methyloglobulus sp.]